MLELFDRGLAYKAIADQLGISVHSVKTYGQRIIVKSMATCLRQAAYHRRQAVGSQSHDPKQPAALRHS